MFMGADDMPSVFGYLRTHGYSIDTTKTVSVYLVELEVFPSTCTFDSVPPGPARPKDPKKSVS